MRKERVNEIWGVVFLLCGLYALASLIFFHPEDIPFYASHPRSPVLNYAGLIGAYLAHGFLLAFGLGAYLIPVFLLLWSFCFFSQRVPERKLFKFVGLVIAVLAASVFLGISFDPEKRFLRAGAVGYVFGSQLLRYFGPVGGYIVTLSCLLLATLLATDFLLYPLVKGLWNSLCESFRFTVSQIRNFLGWVSKIYSWLRSFVSRPRKERPPPSPIHSKPRLAEEPVVKLSISREEKILEDPEKTFKDRKTDSKEKFPRVVSAAGEKKKTESEFAEPIQIQSLNQQVTDYKLPPIDLLRKPEVAPVRSEDLKQSSRIVEETLADFGLEAKVVEVEQGPVITRYELLPAPGVKVNRILSLGDDLALALKATSLRFIAPIPGKSAIGIEVPNTKTSFVYLRELLESREFRSFNYALPLAVGKDASGKPLIADLAQMPHLLIAGATGSGKTVCVNAIIGGLLFHSSPERLKFVMVDPKMVELANFRSIPHMLAPVVTDPKKAAATLHWVVTEMENRYRLFASRGVRNIQGFNAQSDEILPYIVVVIDELADLMMVVQDKIEGAIARLAQLSRAVGIHLILATQRPSVDVITGVIKANFPARISFKVASKVDSRTVLDMNGADKLLGKGDLLFLLPGESKLIRGQGAFVLDEEINRIVEFVSQQKSPEYHPEIQSLQGEQAASATNEKDELFDEAVQVVLETGVASASTLQRRLRLGYTRAARIIDQMEAHKIVGPHRGSKPREILVDRHQALRQTASSE